MQRTLKKNRTDKYTKGLAITNDSNALRFPFFDLDFDFADSFGIVEFAYLNLRYDYLIHRTHNGYHFISPTLLTKEGWKTFHKALKEINPQCPQTTLRWIPNKYPNESEIWYIAKPVYFKNEYRNCEQLCNLLNKIYGSNFVGFQQATLKFVRYPLPK